MILVKIKIKLGKNVKLPKIDHVITLGMAN